MRSKRKFKILFLIIGIVFPIVIIVLLSAFNIPSIWNSWGLQEDGTRVMPDSWNYFLLVFFKLSLYLIPALIISIGLSIYNKHGIERRKYLYYSLHVLSIWFLALLSIKLFSDAILELDRIFDITIFNSIKDVQTLIGFIVTFVLKRTYEIKAGFTKQDKLKEIVQSEKSNENK